MQRHTACEPRAAGTPEMPRKPNGVTRLTRRERWVVENRVKYRGVPNKAIAPALRISPHTLRNHLSSIYAKLGLRRRLDLVLYAMENGLDRNAADGEDRAASM